MADLTAEQIAQIFTPKRFSKRWLGRKIKWSYQHSGMPQFIQILYRIENGINVNQERLKNWSMKNFLAASAGIETLIEFIWLASFSLIDEELWSDLKNKQSRLPRQILGAGILFDFGLIKYADSHGYNLWIWLFLIWQAWRLLVFLGMGSIAIQKKEEESEAINGAKRYIRSAEEIYGDDDDE